MSDEDCVTFLQWALPHLKMHWPGFRRVRRQVCRRLKKRMRELSISRFSTYREHVTCHPEEWALIDGACRITISRFYRDKGVFRVLGDLILPEAAEHAAAQHRDVRCWSAGCASGEEVYSLKIVWERRVKPRAPEVGLSIVGTDVDEAVLRRAEVGCYEQTTLRELPTEWLEDCFDRKDQEYCIKREFREGLSFVLEDIREALPLGPFDIILCRNLAFTYFAPPLQVRTLERINASLRAGGVLVIGAHEHLPEQATGFRPLPACREILRWQSSEAG